MLNSIWSYSSVFAFNHYLLFAVFWKIPFCTKFCTKFLNNFWLGQRREDIWTEFWMAHAAAAAKLLQSCPTLCNPIDSSPPGSPVPGILQARTLEWVAISFYNAWKWKVKGKSLSPVWLSATLGTASLPGSSAHGIFQARGLEWVAIAFSRMAHGSSAKEGEERKGRRCKSKENLCRDQRHETA